MNTHRSRETPRAIRSGSVLVEFAFISLAFYLLFAGTIELGRLITMSQATQTAARIGARELALVALPATATFRDALADPTVRARVYDPHLLAVPVNAGAIPDTDTWPSLNRMLVPLMVYDTINGQDFFHFPGAVVQDDAGGYTVKVAQVVGRDPDGTEQIRWRDVVEEVVYADGVGPFSIAAAPPSEGIPRERGLVALRINCPYQATAMAAYRVVSNPGDPSPVIEAHDAVHVVDGSGPGGALIGVGTDMGAYAGPQGLGKLWCMDKQVRPFRRLISAQSLFRREVYR